MVGKASNELTSILKSHQPKAKQDVFKGVPPGATDPDFEKVLKNHFKQEEEGLKISKHAAKRMEQRNINMDSAEFLKLMQATEELKAKGSRDSLIITDKAAYIVDVKNNTLVTTLEKGNMDDNIVTNIDSTMFV